MLNSTKVSDVITRIYNDDYNGSVAWNHTETKLVFAGERTVRVTEENKESLQGFNLNADQGLFVFDVVSGRIQEVLGLDQALKPIKPIFDETGSGIVFCGAKIPNG